MNTDKEKKASPLAEDYREFLLERLQEPRQAIHYLNAALGDSGDPEIFLMALRDVAEARGMTETARRAGLNRESFYRMLSKRGNPKVSSLYALLEALDFTLKVDHRKAKHPPFKKAA